MADLFKYVCLECDTATYVHWYATEKSQHPYCASCGSDQFMELVAEVDIYDEEKITN